MFGSKPINETLCADAKHVGERKTQALRRGSDGVRRCRACYDRVSGEAQHSDDVVHGGERYYAR